MSSAGRALELLALEQRSQADVEELIGLISIAIEQRNVEFVRTVVADDFELTTRSEWVEGELSYRGADGIADWWRSLDEVLRDLRYEPARLVAQGEDVVVLSQRSRARMPGSDAQVETEVYLVAWIRAGRIARQATFTLRKDALESAGLS